MGTKLIVFLAFAICAGMLFTAHASAEPQTENISPPGGETPVIEEVWLTGDTLHIAVTDKTGGENRTLELNLSNYAKPGDEYVTVQATDKDGRMSDAIRFKNPYYAPRTDTGSDGDADSPVPSDGGNPVETPKQSESAVPEETKPFTPAGRGEVVDDVTGEDDKEFFSIVTEDGNVFYLIVDRQRTTDNVYLLNAVTENDLASLAKPGDGMISSVVPTPSASATTETKPEPEPKSEPEAPAKPGGTGSGAVIFVIIAGLAAGGAGYYFKILRPKRLAAETDDDGGEYEDDIDENDDFDDDADVYGNDERGDNE
jgi:hypothetical protein